MRLLLTVFLLLAIAEVVSAQDDVPKEEQERISQRDFAFQGEYTGQIGTEDDKRDFAIQIIAIGNGKFKAVTYDGGLPGNGWSGKVKSEIADVGQYNESKNAVEFLGDGKLIIQEDMMSLSIEDIAVTASLQKVVRESETLNTTAPEGAMVLFDGTDVEQWANGQMTEDGLLKQGTTSKQTFGNHQLHLEFQLPFMPNAAGQQRGNSGLYIQGRYEIQMLDSFGLDGKQNECGGIYSVKAPDLNMCFPPGSWQTYDVDFTAAKFDDAGEQTAPAQITVKHNGVLIHDNVKLPARKTTAAPVEIGSEKGPIYLQNHGNQVRYRNIWVKEN